MSFEIILSWLMASIDHGRPHIVDGLISWHGRLMVVAWAVLIPMGILVARYLKITPRQKWPEELDNRTWWYSHLTIQWTATVLALIGLGLIIYKIDGISIFDTPHHTLGWFTICLLILQILAGLFRGTKGGPTYPAPDGSLRGDHFDMTLRRRIFEYTHKTSGYIALLSSMATVLTGLWAANGAVWMWLLLILWWVVLFVTAIKLQRQKLAIDTYQAIWGPNPELLGNKTKPIGFGVHRAGDL